MTGAAWASGVRGTHEIRDAHGSALGSLIVALAEFGRAIAAAQRYEDLRYGRGRHEGIARTDIPRRIFEEFYSDSGDPATAPHRARASVVEKNPNRAPKADQ